MALGSELTGRCVSRVVCVWFSQACSSDRACWNWPRASRAASSLCCGGRKTQGLTIKIDTQGTHNFIYSKRNRGVRARSRRKGLSWNIFLSQPGTNEECRFLNVCIIYFRTCRWVILSPRLSQRCRSSVSGSWIMSLSVWSDTFFNNSSPWWQSFSMSICCW